MLDENEIGFPGILFYIIMHSQGPNNPPASASTDIGGNLPKSKLLKGRKNLQLFGLCVSLMILMWQKSKLDSLQISGSLQIT